MNVRELLPLYALGAVDDDEVVQVERALAADPNLVDELAALRAATVELAGGLPPIAPSAALRDRLMASVASRYERFVGRFAAMFDVAADRARELLALVDRADAWEPGPGPGSALIHFTAGPAFAGADTGFVRLEPGARFAKHRHTGRELSLVLAGRAHDTLSGDLGPGDQALAEGDTSHDFYTVGDEPFIFAVWVWGVDFGAQ